MDRGKAEIVEAVDRDEPELKELARDI